jgi:hypothetical protein
VVARSPNPKHVNRRDWNLYEDYKRIHERKLAGYSFILGSSQAFNEIEWDGRLFVVYEGEFALPEGMTLQVTKAFETKRMGPGRGSLYVRGFSYRYNAHIRGKHTVLRYDNNDDFDDYHGHWWNKETGELLKRRSMSRDEFPLFTEVLDELDQIMGFTAKE